MTLLEHCRAYAEAGPYTLARQEAGFLELRHEQGPALLVWADESERAPASALTDAQRQQRAADEAALLDAFSREMAAAGPGARGVYLVPRRVGLSAEFPREAAARLGAGGGVRVPVEFFDTDYRFEGAAGQRRYSAVRGVLNQARRLRRVPQPFFRRTGLAPGDRAPGGDDLVDHLVEALGRPASGPCLRLIDGPAGGGKTVAFNALTAGLYERFMEAKRRRQAVPRPVMFNQGHLRGTGPAGDGPARVHDLVEAVIALELAQAVTPAQFTWLLHHGYATWLFDGLDEVYGADPAFFHRVGELLDAADSRAQILVCTRDSLLGASPELRQFVSTWQASGKPLEIYELAPWSEDAWRRAAWIRLERELPGKEASPRVARFVDEVQRSSILKELATLPFYCAELLRMAEDDALSVRSEFDVMAAIVGRMLEREHDKELFDWSDFGGAAAIPLLGELPEADRQALVEGLRQAGRENLEEILEVIAFLRQRAKDEHGPSVPVQLVRDMLSVHHPAGAASPQGAEAALALVQFAFFGLGGEADTLDFSHPIVADYLAARYAAKNLRDAKSTAGVRQSIGRMSVPPGSAFVRFLAHEASEDPVMRERLESARADPGLEDGLRVFIGLLLGS